jgi:hypothetical protein
MIAEEAKTEVLRRMNARFIDLDEERRDALKQGDFKRCLLIEEEQDRLAWSIQKWSVEHGCG